MRPESKRLARSRWVYRGHLVAALEEMELRNWRHWFVGRVYG